MTSPHAFRGRLALLAGLLTASHAHAAEPLTADRAVQVALQHSSQTANAAASVLDARGGLYSAYSGVVPRLSAIVSRSGSWVRSQSGSESFGSFQTPSSTFDSDAYSTTPQVTGTWSVLNLSNLTGVMSARQNVKAARLQQTSARNDVALSVRRQFYTVVGAIHLARVNGEALKLSRDDERRVRALFEVGSVSKSDVLKAQVATAQSELDSLTSVQQITTQRIALATALGVAEGELGDIDTTLTVTPNEYDEADLQAQAARNRPDLKAAEADLKAASAARWSARLARLPYITVSGAAQFKPKSSSTTTELDPPPPDTSSSSHSETDKVYRASIALNWDFFDGFATDARNASTQASLIRARDTRDVLRRNLEADVRQSLLSYREALESWKVATRAVESASENLKLTQEKYNVGSSTILDLIDAQVQLQRAQNQDVNARARVRTAEAGIRRAIGQGE